MKKLLGLTLALALVSVYMPAQASAELLRNLRLSGQLDVQSQASRNVLDMVTRPNPSVDPGNAAFQDFNDRLGNAQTRLMLNLDFDLLDDVHAKVTLRKNDRNWGDPGNTTGNGANGNTGTGQSLLTTGQDTVLGQTFVDQANVKVSKTLGGLLDATIGRQYFGDPGDVVAYFGPSNVDGSNPLYGLPVSALDALRVDVPVMGDMLGLTGLAAKITGSNTGTVDAADVDLRAIVAKSKPMDGLNVQAHIYNQQTHGINALGNVLNQYQTGGANITNRNDNLWVYGAKARWMGMGLNIGAEVNKNGGENHDNRSLAARQITNFAGNAAGHVAGAANYLGWMTRLDASYKADLEGIAMFMPWIDFAYGTGRGDITENKNEGFQSIRGDFRPGTIYGRFAPTGAVTLGQGVPCFQNANGANNNGCTAGAAATNTGTLAGGVSSNGLNNRVIWGLGLKTTPAALNQLTAGVSFWHFAFQRVTGNGYNSTTLGQQGVGRALVAGLNGQGNNQKHIGSELDFDLMWKHSDNVMFNAGVASFRPGKYIQELVKSAAGIANLAGNNQGEVAYNPVVLAYGEARIKF